MPADVEAILKLEVSVIVEIARRTMTVDEVLTIAPGAIIELPARANDPLTILINNKPIGYGKAVKVAENFGVHVMHVGDVADKLEAVRSLSASVATEAEGAGAADADDDSQAADDAEAEALADQMLAE